MKKNPIIYIEHIAACIAKIKAYTEGIDEATFLENNLIQDAVIRNFEIIGEATKNSIQIFGQNIQQLNGRRLPVCAIS